MGYDDKERMDKIKDVSEKIENVDPKEVAGQIVNQTEGDRRGRGEEALQRVPNLPYNERAL